MKNQRNKTNERYFQKLYAPAGFRKSAILTGWPITPLTKPDMSGNRLAGELERTTFQFARRVVECNVDVFAIYRFVRSF